MTNPAVITLLAILMLLATAFWRVITGRDSNGYHTIWITGIATLALAFLTDLQPSLGAAISAAALVFFVINTVKKPAGTWKAPSPNGSTAGNSGPTPSITPSSGGSGQTTPTPANPFPGHGIQAN